MTEPSPRTPLSAILLTVGGVGAAFAAASCCGLPFLLASTGIGFAWLTGLAIFSAPYRPLLLFGAAVCLLGAPRSCGASRRSRGPVASAPSHSQGTRLLSAWRSVPCCFTWDMPMPEIVLHSAITCPECGHIKVEMMPTDACQFFYDCTGCGAVLRPKPGDCCVFCSYGSVPCPPIQAGEGCCTEG